MEWRVKYELLTHALPWCVYKYFENSRVFQQSFWNEEEARSFAQQKEKHFERPDGEKINKVEEDSLESFPASDLPAWTDSIVNSCDKHSLNFSKKKGAG